MYDPPPPSPPHPLCTPPALCTTNTRHLSRPSLLQHTRCTQAPDAPPPHESALRLSPRFTPPPHIPLSRPAAAAAHSRHCPAGCNAQRGGAKVRRAVRQAVGGWGAAVWCMGVCGWGGGARPVNTIHGCGSGGGEGHPAGAPPSPTDTSGDAAAWAPAPSPSPLLLLGLRGARPAPTSPLLLQLLRLLLGLPRLLLLLLVFLPLIHLFGEQVCKLAAGGASRRNAPAGRGGGGGWREGVCVCGSGGAGGRMPAPIPPTHMHSPTPHPPHGQQQLPVAKAERRILAVHGSRARESAAPARAR